MTQAIGKYFENAAANVDTPGYWSGDMNGYMYVPDADESMSDADLQKNYEDLLYRINWWSKLPGLVYLNSTSKSNVAYIVEFYSTVKKPAYDAMIAARQEASATNDTTATPTTNNTNNNTTENTQSEGKNYLPLILGGVALVGYYLYRKGKLKLK